MLYMREPLTVLGDNPAKHAFEVATSEGFVVATVHYHVGGCGRWMAESNAYLMAAAGELWNACHTAMKFLEVNGFYHSPIHEQLKEACAKAGGAYKTKAQ